MKSNYVVLGGWQQSLFDIEAYWLENPPARELVRRERISKIGSNGWIYTTDGQHLNPRYYAPEQKRIPVGWIEKRISNPKRPNPYTCYYFCWNEKDEEGRWRKRKTYIPKNQINEIYIKVLNKLPYWETLKLIRKSKPRHTPKI